MELSENAKYLKVDVDVWFNWPQSVRSEYIKEFQKLKVENVLQQKPIDVETAHDECQPDQEFAFDLLHELVGTLNIGDHLAELINREALKLLNNQAAVRKKPALQAGKETTL